VAEDACGICRVRQQAPAHPSGAGTIQRTRSREDTGKEVLRSEVVRSWERAKERKAGSSVSGGGPTNARSVSMAMMQIRQVSMGMRQALVAVFMNVPSRGQQARMLVVVMTIVMAMGMDVHASLVCMAVRMPIHK